MMHKTEMKDKLRYFFEIENNIFEVKSILFSIGLKTIKYYEYFFTLGQFHCKKYICEIRVCNCKLK